MKNFFLISLLISISYLAACSKKEGDGMPPAMVTIIPITTQLWQPNVQETGTVNAIVGAELKSEIAGRITKIYFKPGQQVHAGDILMDINPSQLVASYRSAEADYNLANANLGRARQLFHQKFLAKQDYETTLDQQKTAKARLNLASAQLDQAEIKAPFDGVVGINKVNLGDYVNTGVALVNLEQLNQLRVDFTVPEKLVGKIQIGDRVTLQSKENSNEVYTGSVVGLDTAIDQNTRMFSVRAVFPNTVKNPSVLPGAFAEVNLFYGPTKQQMVVPQESVISNGDSNNLYVVTNGHAKLTPVKLGERFADKVVVESGVKAGDLIVAAGTVKVHDGMPVIDPTMMAKQTAASKKPPHG